MSSLTSSQINQSYQGLLKLEDSTTGITSSLQSVQDGLGNDTGVKISTNRFEGANLFNITRPLTIPKYFGNGIGALQTPPANTANIILTTMFYDNGQYSYSALTSSCITLGAGESVDISFYNTQYLEGYGYVPYQKLTSTFNIDATSTGLKTVTFGSPLSFSGAGPGFYFAVAKINSGGVTPTSRFAGPAFSIGTYATFLTPFLLGFNASTGGANFIAPFQQIGSTIPSVQTFNTPTFPTTWTSTELSLLQLTSAVNFIPGFVLHTIR